MIAIYAGSFDPITNGHTDIITRASKAFEKVIVAIGVNSSKKPMFPAMERAEHIQAVCSHLANVEVRIVHGLLAEFAHSLGTPAVLIRGLRALTDFDYEMGIAHANAQLAPDVDTFFIATRPENSFVSSSVVRELARHGADVSYYVSPVIQEALRKYHST